MKGLLYAIAATVIGGLIVWYLTGSDSPFHHNKPSGPSVTAGAIEAINVNSYSPCCTFNVKALIQGYDGKTCPLYATVVNNSTHRAATPIQVTGYQPQAGEDEGAFNDYVPIYVAGEWYVRFTLYAPNNTELDQQDSIVITVR
jgi:hypothetical protein